MPNLRLQTICTLLMISSACSLAAMLRPILPQPPGGVPYNWGGQISGTKRPAEADIARPAKRCTCCQRCLECVEQPQAGFSEGDLESAIKWGNSAKVKQLLRSGVPVAQHHLNILAKRSCVYSGAMEIAQLLIDHGALRKRRDQQSPLHNAAYHHNSELVELFLRNGADPNTEDRCSRTVLNKLLLGVWRIPEKKRGWIARDVVPTLLEYGAQLDTNLKDSQGRSVYAIELAKLWPYALYYHYVHFPHPHEQMMPAQLTLVQHCAQQIVRDALAAGKKINFEAVPQDLHSTLVRELIMCSQNVCQLRGNIERVGGSEFMLALAKGASPQLAGPTYEFFDKNTGHLDETKMLLDGDTKQKIQERIERQFFPIQS